MLMDRTCLAGVLGSTLSRKHAYWTMDPPGVEPARGGGVRIKWLNHLKGTFRCDKSLRHQNDCPQYIPKGKQTPASKLAFVIKKLNEKFEVSFDKGLHGRIWFCNLAHDLKTRGPYMHNISLAAINFLKNAGDIEIHWQFKHILLLCD